MYKEIVLTWIVRYNLRQDRIKEQCGDKRNDAQAISKPHTSDEQQPYRRPDIMTETRKKNNESRIKYETPQWEPPVECGLDSLWHVSSYLDSGWSGHKRTELHWMYKVQNCVRRKMHDRHHTHAAELTVRRARGRDKSTENKAICYNWTKKLQKGSKG